MEKKCCQSICKTISLTNIFFYLFLNIAIFQAVQLDYPKYVFGATDRYKHGFMLLYVYPRYQCPKC
jgi:hypothetical protein